MPAPSTRSGLGRRDPRRGGAARAAFTMVEVVATMMLAVVLGVVVTGGFLMSQRMAAANRIRTQARVILQRNIDLALSLPFTSVNIPACLALTPESGDPDQDPPKVPFNDPSLPAPPSGREGEVPLLRHPDGSVSVAGTLLRTVQLQTDPNPAGAVIHRVTFTLSYDYLGRSQEISLTTLRARDDH